MEHKIPRCRSEQTLLLSQAMVASVAPWRRTVRTLPWWSTCPTFSPSYATWLFCSGTTPVHRSSFDYIDHCRFSYLNFSYFSYAIDYLSLSISQLLHYSMLLPVTRVHKSVRPSCYCTRYCRNLFLADIGMIMSVCRSGCVAVHFG